MNTALQKQPLLQRLLLLFHIFYSITTVLVIFPSNGIGIYAVLVQTVRVTLWLPPERTYVILNALGEAVYQTLAGLFSSNRQKNRSIDGFIERMEANISNPDFHLTREIEKYGYNAIYFRKLFKHTIGESPLSYFNRIRIEYAQKEFHHYGPSRSVKDIASASGFTDPYYFSRIFKKITGVSPKSYVSNLGSFDPKIIHKEEPH